MSEPLAQATVGVIVVDHGSRRPEAHEAMKRFAIELASASGHEIVEMAHMELAAPSIGEAFDRCVERGADVVVIAPLFFWPGVHWTRDIPALAAAAAARHPGVRHVVTAPVGTHPLLADLVQARVDQCLQHATGGPACSACEHDDLCRMR